MSFQKHRLAEKIYEFDFSGELAVNETFQGNPVVKIAYGARSGPFVDVTEEFIDDETPPVVLDKRVQFVLKQADDDEQLPGIYFIYCEIGTNSDQRLTAYTDLIIDDIPTG